MTKREDVINDCNDALGHFETYLMRWEIALDEGKVELEGMYIGEEEKLYNNKAYENLIKLLNGIRIALYGGGPNG